MWVIGGASRANFHIGYGSGKSPMDERVKRNVSFRITFDIE